MTAIVDIHTHVISPDTARYPLAPLGGKQSDWSHAHPCTAEALVAALDEAGVEKAAVVQASTAYGFDNSYAEHAIKTFPDRFTGVFSMDLFAPDATAVFDRWVTAGFAGLRLFTTGTTQPGQAGWLADPRTFPVWELAEATGVPVCVQMRPEGVDQLTVLLDRFRSVPVVLDHLARVDLSDGAPYNKSDWLWRLAERPNVVLKLTSRTVREASSGASRPEDFFPRLVQAYGAERIAWGSNFPAEPGPMSRILAAARIALACLSETDRATIFAGTARRLYPALAAAPVPA